MIGENELRIGNLVLEYGIYTKIESGHDIDLMAKQFEPIPLTPEILLKCGFERDAKAPKSFYYKDISYERSKIRWRRLLVTYHGKKIDITIQNGNTEVDKYPLDSVTIHREVYHGKYHLHQLQNLYYCLTGEELTCTL